MQLIYFYAESEIFSKFQINLSSQYNVSFDPDDKELTIIESGESYSRFKRIMSKYPFINDMKVIVGKNGSGKTSIIRQIIDIYAEAEGVLCIYKEHGKLFYINNIHDKDDYEPEYQYIPYMKFTFGHGSIDCQESSYKNFLDVKNERENLKTIYFSNVFDNMHMSRIKNFVDISTNHLMWEADNKINSGNQNIVGKSAIKWYNSQQIRRYMTLLDDGVIAEEVEKIRFKVKSINRYRNVESFVDNEEMESFDRYFSVASFAIEGGKDRTKYDILQPIVRQIVVENKEVLEHLQNVEFDNLDIFKNYDIFFGRITELKNLGEWITEVTELKEYLNQLLEDGTIPRTEVLGLNDAITRFNRIQVTIDIEGLSSGEIAKINMYSRFKELLTSKTIDDKDSEFTIIIDECDAYMHPEYQRQFIKDFLEMCQRLYDKKKINIILTTHSPILLSDMPKENIVCLNKQNGVVRAESCFMDTFGQNIHTILKNEFIMDYTMGDFVKETILNLKEELVQKQQKDISVASLDLESIKSVIGIIGEPIIKNYLFDLVGDWEKQLKE